MQSKPISPCSLMEERDVRVPSKCPSPLISFKSSAEQNLPQTSVRRANDVGLHDSPINEGSIRFTANNDAASIKTPLDLNDQFPAPYRCGISSRSINVPVQQSDQPRNNYQGGWKCHFKAYCVSIVSQCFASLISMFHRKRRHLAAVFVEVILIPLFFVLVMGLLQRQYTNAPAQDMIRPPQYKPELVVPNSYQSVLCYNASAFEEVSSETGNTLEKGIAGLDKCPMTVTQCATNPRLPFPPYSLCLLQNRNKWSYSISSFIEASSGSAMSIYNLDAIIAKQWIYLAAEEELSQEKIKQGGIDLSLLLSENSRLDSIQCGGRLYFAPAVNIPDELIHYLNSTSSFFRYVYGGIFDTVSAARDYVSSNDPSNLQGNWGIVVVKENLETAFDIELQLNSSALPTINIPQKNLGFNGFFQYNTAEMFAVSGFVYLQKVLYDYFLVTQKRNNRIDTMYDPQTSSLPFIVSLSTPPQARDYLLIKYAGAFVCLFISFTFIYPFTQMVKSVVLERELRMREATAIMGLHRTAMYMSYFLWNTIQGTITSTIFSAALHCCVAKKSDFLVVWLIFWGFYMTLIPLAAFCAAFFTSARFATHMAPIVYFALVALPFFLFVMSNASPIVIRYALPAVLSSASFMSLLDNLLLMSSGGGFYFSDLSIPFVTPSLSYMLIILVCNYWIYVLLLVYIDFVTPGNFGPPHHPLFFLLQPYRYLVRCCNGPKHEENEEFDSEEDKVIQSGFEKRTAGPVVVRLDRLVKQFTKTGKSFRAVNELSWTVHNREITVLLGENGAGKSTTINVITGMEGIDRGNVYVENYSVKEDLSFVRQRLGYCPQHNILWPDLSCQEHLEFFGRLKGLRSKALDARVKEMLSLVDLQDKCDALPHQLSGGQKRKLCVAIAFVGDNSLVILDEPTAGMDAAARRHVWHVLRMMSSQCAILLTTHFLDEADLLGDHIGILNAGKLQCSGNTLFLKSVFGNGYTLSIELNEPDIHDRVGEELRRIMPGLHLLSENAREKLFSVPKVCSTLPDALRLLEQSGLKLGVQSFSISATTLEEVFLNAVKKDKYREGIAARLSPTDEDVSSRGKQSADKAHVVQANDDVAQSSNSSPIECLNGTVAFQGDHEEVLTETNHSSLTVSPETVENSFPATDNNAVLLQEVHEWWISGDDTAGDHRCLSEELSAVNLSVFQRIRNGWRRSDTCRQCWAVFRSRFQYMTRDRKFQVLQILSPVMCTIVAMVLLLIHFSSSSIPVEYSFRDFGSDLHTSAAACVSLLGDSLQWNQDVFVEEGVNPNIQYLDNVSSTQQLESRMMSTWYTGSRKEPQYMGYMCNDHVFIDPIHVQSPQTVPITMSGLGILYNTSSTLSLPVALHELFHQILRNGAKETSTQFPLFRLTSTSMPNPSGVTSKSDNPVIHSLLMCLILVIPFTFLPSTPASWIVKERQANIQHLQLLAGLSKLRYWISNFIFDWLSYLTSAFLVVLTLICFRRSEFVGGPVILPFVLGLVLYGACSITMSYTLSFLFNDHTTAQHVITTLNFITGFVLLVVICVLDFLSSSPSLTMNIRYGFRVFPSFCMGDIFLSLVYYFRGMLDADITPWSMRIIGWPCVYMTVDLVCLVVLISILEHPLRKYYCARLYIFFLRSCCGVHIPQETKGEKGEFIDASLVPPIAQVTAFQKEHSENFVLSERNSNTSEDLVSAESTQEVPENVQRSSDLQVLPQPAARSSHFRTTTERDETTHYSVLRQASIGHGVYGPHPNRSAVGGHTAFCVKDSSLRGGGPAESFVSLLYYDQDMDERINPNREVNESLYGRKHRNGASSRSVQVRTMEPLMSNEPIESSQEQGECVGNDFGHQRKHQKQEASIMLPWTSFQQDCSSNIIVEEELFPNTPSFREPITEGPLPDQKTCKKISLHARLSGEDSDVEDERLAVIHDIYGTSKREDPLQLLNVRKVYPTGHVAVRSLAFSAMRGEVFALLGSNGSGKSTTMSMVCQAQVPTSGKIFVGGHNTMLESEAAKKSVGYCPQFDATYDLLTVKEHLVLYADVHGVPLKEREHTIALLMRVCGIEIYSNVVAKQLSGGSRRKLSVAIALLGRPSVVCMDEPSAGMDPLARRNLWESILTISKECCVLLTTHHMEEVEALANCVAIMSHGTMRCIGGLPHLKRKYGSGYEVQLRFDRARNGILSNTWGTEDDAVEAFITDLFPGCVMTECFRGERYVLSLPDGTILSEVFEQLQRYQEEAGMTDFMISQTTIEQVFLRFCDLQEEDRLDMGGVIPRTTHFKSNEGNSDLPSSTDRKASGIKPRKQKWGVSYRMYDEVKPNDICPVGKDGPVHPMDVDSFRRNEGFTQTRESAQRRR